MNEILISSVIEKESEIIYDVPGYHTFKVPADVTSICAVVVGGGGGDNRSLNSSVNAGGGGGLSWRNNIPVKPGDLLEVLVGAGGKSRTNFAYGEDGGRSRIRDANQEILIDTEGGKGGSGSTSGSTSLGGRGGKNLRPINDGGGNGGVSNWHKLSPTSGGGGAGGYTGNGGNGKGYEGSAQNGTGGGGGGGYEGYRTTKPGGDGGGVGLYGIGEDGKMGDSVHVNGYPGSVLVSEKVYGGGAGAWSPNKKGQDGAVRIIWGVGRSFPNNAK